MGAGMVKKKVMIYIPSSTGFQSSKFVESLLVLLEDCSKHKDKFEFYVKIGMRATIADSRNIACEMALDCGADYLLWLDDDMVCFPKMDYFTNLIKHDKDYVAPLFFQRKKPFLPCIFKGQRHKDGIRYRHILDYKKGLIEVDATGFGCVLMKTEMLRHIKEPFFEYRDGLGEDIYFCIKAKKAKYRLYCDTTLDMGHIMDSPVSAEESFLSHKKEAVKFEKDKAKTNKKNEKAYARNVGIKRYKTDIIIPCYKNKKITKDYIEDLYKNTDIEHFNLILINDGNDVSLANYFKELLSKKKNILRVITNDTALGWVKSVNLGLKEVKSEYVIISNNDIRINDRLWLQTMASKFGKDIGCVVPTSDYVMGLQNIGYNTDFIRRGLASHYTKIAVGFFMMLTKEAVDTIGGFDEIFGIGGNDDLDYSIRLRKAGYNIVVARDVFIRHLGSKSLPMVCDVENLDKKTRELLIKKWGEKEVNDLFKIDDFYLRQGENI